MYKRVRTLLLPYLLWSAYGILFLALLQLLPQSRPFFNKTPISHYTLFQLLDTLFFHPVPYQFWFLRDLIFMVVLSPLLYPAVRILGLPWLAACLILWGWSPTVPFFISEDLQSPFFFCLGIWLALKAREEMTGVQWGARHGLWLFGGWLLVLAVKTTLDLDPGVSVSIRDVLYELSILLGVPACWSLYDVCYLRWKKRRVRAWLLRLYGVGIFSYSFFIYAFHEPVLTLLRKVLNILSGERGSVSPLPVFFLAPLLTIGLALVVAYGIKKAGLSGLYAAITGDR